MAQTLTPIATLLDRGEGIADLQAALAAATSSELRFANDGDMVLFVDNGDASPKTATLLATPDPFGRGESANNEAIAVPAGETGMFPFMNPAMFNDVGVASVTLSATTSVAVGLYRLVKRG